MNLTKPQKLIYDMEKYAGGAISVICGSMLIDGKEDINKIKQAVNEIYRINDALRIRLTEEKGEVVQSIANYTEQTIDVLCFNDKAELDSYAENYAKIPLDFHGKLCEIHIVSMPQHYGLLVKLHHIIGDAWTLSLIGTQFNKLMNGDAVEAYSYADYIENENNYINSNRYEKDKLFFMEQFKKCDEVTYLSEKQTDSLDACRMTFVIDNDRSRQIIDYAKQHGVSVFMLFMAALSVYINRVKMNTEHFYIGTAVLNRIGNRAKNTMGMFVNTVPMLIELDNKKSFIDNLYNIEKTSFSVFRHQKYNYGDVLSAIRGEYGFGEKLYDVIISYQNASVCGSKVETTWYHSGLQAESLQIHIDDRDNDGIFRIHYDYQTEKYTDKAIDMLHRHICNLIFSAIADSGKKLYELDILTQNEKHKLLYDFNDTAIDYPKDKCVHQLFEEQVEKTPDKVAVIAFDRALTYREINEEANKIAHSLIEKNVGVGDIVAFVLPRKSYLISTMFGILKSGAAYLPIDPDYPKERIEYVLSDSNVRLVIDESNITKMISNANTINPQIKIRGHNLCYCIYTSGSTGKPKGVLIHHNSVTNFCDANKINFFQQTLIKNCDSVIACNNTVFDIVLQEILLPLINSITVIFLDSCNDVRKINSNIISDKMGLIITPSKMKIFLDDYCFTNNLKRFSVIMCGAENLFVSLVERMKENSESIIINGYGPTETTCGVLYSEIKKESEISIGKPIANTQIYIVDKYMKPTPIGVTGELCIAGDCVGAGYLNRPELTAEKFIDNPFGKGKLYKTGDLAYWREDGNIVYVGRNDFQVKIRGLRIELGEIENAICSIDGISQAVTVVRKNNEGRQLICAFYTGEALDAKEIRSIIGNRLPKYMLPHIITHLDDMPLTSSGKINRKALPEVDLYTIDTDVEYVAPQTAQEIILTSAIQSTLSTDRVGIMDNFFDIGGDSLKAIELISNLEKEGYHTDTKTIFECNTVKELAEKLSISESAQAPLNYSGAIPASAAQLRIYTAQSMDADSTMYNVPYVFDVEDEIDINRLQSAVNALIMRHESLRTHFENIDGDIIQVVEKNAECIVERPENRNITAFIKPFDLSLAPLLRIGVCGKTIMIDMHHIITDGGSMPVFFRELNELYMGRKLENNPIQYSQFTLQKQCRSESEKYWLSVYSDEIPTLELNTDFKRGAKQSYNGSAIYDTVDIGLHSQILSFCNKHKITPYVFYMAGFNILLSKFSCNEDIIVGMPISGREAKYLDTIGMFVNTIALRNKPVGSKTVIEFLNEVKKNSVDAINYQDYSYSELIKKLGIHTQNRNPLFDIMFAYQSEQMTDVTFGDKKAHLIPIDVTTSKYDFTFNIMPRENDVVIMAEYCSDLYKKETIERYIDGFKLILNQLLTENAYLKDITSVSADECNKLLYVFNDTAIDYPKDKCVHQLFEEQVEKTPDKVAVIACDRTLTYLQLKNEVQKYADRLVSFGIGKGDVVAIHINRSYNLIAFQLAVLKFGAVFLPVDKRYPVERIEYMCKDCNVKLLISDEFKERVFNTDVISILDFEKTTATVQAATVYNADLCYIIYTSGSTGKPKGCLLTGKNLLNFCVNNNTLETLKSLNNCVFACVNSVSFDYFIAESLLPLSNGFTTVICDDEESTIQSRFFDVLSKYSVNTVMTTPTRLKIYFSDKLDCSVLTQLKCICTSGEPLTPELLAELYMKSPDAQIYNPIGPSECSVWDVGGKLCKTNGLDIHIGKPIANVQLYIVDKYMKPTPICVTGELCIAGDGVGAGYLNRPELTAEKFIDNPFGDGKLYKTGDLAYWREDGNIVYVGRNDFQVKIRGLRIELGEIENAICSIDGISQAVTVVRKNNEGRQLICAFYTGEALDAKEIRSIIGNRLPKYMLPHVITHLNDMPLTSSGKINRKALPEVDLYNIATEREYIAPENAQQKKLCSLIEEVLETSTVGVTDDFFDMGGDSLKAIEYVSKAHNDGIYFNLQNVFDYPSVKALCAFLEKGDKQAVVFKETDFEQINKILRKNKSEHIIIPEKCDPGNILLAGATGYLGIHILANYLDNDNGTAYCLVRGKDVNDSKKRLTDLLKFYFGDKYFNCDRINIIHADLLKDRFGLSDDEYTVLLENVDTVINCAASVKHYGSYKYFYESNVETVKRLIDFTRQANAKLIHTSTLSVSGNSFGDSFDGYISKEEKHFYESDLYIGQPLENVYAHSKFEAEKAVLDAMADGLHANIMRMGNLTNRYSDGMFQKNYNTNAFLQRIRGILELGLFPDYLINETNYAEFTPIDEAAEAVMMIVRHFSSENTVFHINSDKVVYFNNLINIFDELGFNVKLISGSEFTEVLRRTAKQSGMEHIFETFINDIDENDQLNYDSNIRIESDFTVRYLKKLGFEWGTIDFNYLRKYVEYFRQIGFFGDSNEK